MRKFITLLFVAALALVLAACTGGGNDNGANGEDTPGVNGGGEVPGGQVVPPRAISPDRTRAEILADIEARGLDRASIVHDGSYINLASGTRATVNMHYGWDNIAVNAQARRLMFEPLSTIESNTRREAFPNPMVINSAAGGIQLVDNADGSRTYIFNIYTENLWSDGRRITAHDYVGWLLLSAHPDKLEVQVWPEGETWMVGRAAYAAGDTNYMSGVRLISESAFSVTAYADRLPYVFEAFIYMNHYPMPLHAMLPGFDTQTQVRDSENGAYLVGITPELIDAGINGTLTHVRRTAADGSYATNDDGEYIYDLVGGTGFRFAPSVTSGPYVFYNFDTSSFMLTLRYNPYFVGTWDGYRPRITYVVFSNWLDGVVLDAMITGQAHMVSNRGGGVMINSMFEHLVGAGTHFAVDYERNGQGFLRFHTDHGPTQFTAVRQALKWLIDRDEFAEMFTRGHGVVTHAMYGLPHWWTQRAVDQGLYEQLIIYTHNPTIAIGILEDGGWVLNSAGEPFVLGVDPVRYKDVTDLEQWDGVKPFADDKTVYEVDGRLLMRLDIHWATWPTADNPITEVFEVLVPDEMEAVGMGLVIHRMGNPLMHLSRSENPEPLYHLFNQGQTFDPRVWRPWAWVNLDYLGVHNMTWTRDPNLLPVAERMARIETTTPEGEAAFVQAFIETMVLFNYEALEIPLYVDIWYDFVPVWLNNWYNNSIWGFDHAIVRAYICPDHADRPTR
jgi:peptide/nickel transport system substrate-binding protein